MIDWDSLDRDDCDSSADHQGKCLVVDLPITMYPPADGRIYNMLRTAVEERQAAGQIPDGSTRCLFCEDGHFHTYKRTDKYPKKARLRRFHSEDHEDYNGMEDHPEGEFVRFEDVRQDLEAPDSSEVYYVIWNSDGDTTVKVFTKEQLEKGLAQNHWGNNCTPLRTLECDDADTNDWGDSILIIKGAIVTP